MTDCVHELRTPTQLASYLSKSLTCPSSIVAATANHFGRDRAITRSKAEELVALRQKERDVIKARYMKRIGSDHPDVLPEPEVVPELPKQPEPQPPLKLAAIVHPANGRLPLDDVKAGIARVFNLPVSDFKVDSRLHEKVRMRAVLCRIMKDRGLSYPVIGRLMGGKDHSTIMNALRKFEQYARQDHRVMDAYELVKDRIAA